MNASFPLRKECPPGACICERDHLLADPQGDRRILLLTKEEEKRLVARLETLATLEDLMAMRARMHAQLGIVLHIEPSANEVRTVRGISIELAEQRGLCRKTRKAIPEAIRKSMERQPEIAYGLLDEGGQFEEA